MVAVAIAGRAGSYGAISAFDLSEMRNLSRVLHAGSGNYPGARDSLPELIAGAQDERSEAAIPNPNSASAVAELLLRRSVAGPDRLTPPTNGHLIRPRTRRHLILAAAGMGL